jgi:hypothetical protein
MRLVDVSNKGLYMALNIGIKCTDCSISVPITTNVVSSNPAQAWSTQYNIM